MGNGIHMTDLTDALVALDAAVEACPHHGRGHDGWTLEHEGEFAGMWVHPAEDCRRPSVATLLRERG